MIPDAVLKIGGSLLASRRISALLDVLAERSAAGRRLVIVPGGGPFADTVRAACALHRPGDSAAHWMAVLAMDQHAHLLAGLEKRGRLVRGPATAAAALRARRLALLAPSAWLRAADPLPHSWEVTSDSIAAWVAAALGAPRLILLKSVEGIRGAEGEVLPEISRAALAGAPEVDRYFARSLSPRVSCWLVSGRHPARVRELLEGGRPRGTRVRRARAPREGAARERR